MPDLPPDPQPYGSAEHPVRQDPTQYIVEVHWGDGIVGFEVQFLLDLALSPGTIDPIEPNFNLNTAVGFDDSGGLLVVTGPPIIIPPFGTWTATLQLNVNAPYDEMPGHFSFVNLYGTIESASGDILATTPLVSQENSDGFAGFSVTVSGGGPAVTGLTARVHGILGGGASPGHGMFTPVGNVGGGSFLEVLWQSE